MSASLLFPRSLTPIGARGSRRASSFVLVGELLPEAGRLEDLGDDGEVEHEDGHVGNHLHQHQLAPKDVVGHVVGIVSETPEEKCGIIDDGSDFASKEKPPKRRNGPFFPLGRDGDGGNEPFSPPQREIGSSPFPPFSPEMESRFPSRIHRVGLFSTPVSSRYSSSSRRPIIHLIYPLPESWAAQEETAKANNDVILTTKRKKEGTTKASIDRSDREEGTYALNPEDLLPRVRAMTLTHVVLMT